MSWLMASPLAVPGIGRARFDEHTTPGGRTRMMMMTMSSSAVCWSFAASSKFGLPAKS